MVLWGAMLGSTLATFLPECCLRNTLFHLSGDTLVTAAMLGSIVDTNSASELGF